MAARAYPAAPDRVLALISSPLPGRLAQLGERRLDKAEVTGSSPVSPTADRSCAGVSQALRKPVRSGGSESGPVCGDLRASPERWTARGQPGGCRQEGRPVSVPRVPELDSGRARA